MYRKGYISTQLILSIFILSICIIICFSLFRIIIKFKLNDESIQDQIGLIQLSRYVSISEVIRVDDEFLEIDINGENFKISNVNNNLIIQPGTQFILCGIDDAHFYRNNGLIYLRYLRNNYQEEVIIAHE